MKNKILNILKNKLVRFFIVSGINTVFGYSLFALLTYLGLHYILAIIISTVIGILFNFKTIGLLVFKTHNNGLILRFFGVYGVNCVFNVGGLTLLKWVGLSTYSGQAILVVPLGVMGFLMNKTFVFNVKEKGGNALPILNDEFI